MTTNPEQLIRKLEGDEDIRILTKEQTEKMYSSQVKMKMLDKLETETIRSMRHLARRCNSDKGTVRKYLREFEEQGLVKIEDSTFKGSKAKRPKLKYDVIIPHPTIRRES